MGPVLCSAFSAFHATVNKVSRQCEAAFFLQHRRRWTDVITCVFPGIYQPIDTVMVLTVAETGLELPWKKLGAQTA
jgi:hypothetical protein